MVFALLLSVATGAAGVALTAAAWGAANSAGVFTDLQAVIGRSTTYSTFDVYSVAGFGPVVGLAAVVALAGLVWFPSLALLLGVAYNAAARLVGHPVYTVQRWNPSRPPQP